MENRDEYVLRGSCKLTVTFIDNKRRHREGSLRLRCMQGRWNVIWEEPNSLVFAVSLTYSTGRDSVQNEEVG